MSTKKEIVKNGKLITPMQNMESALQTGQMPTGYAGRIALMSGTAAVNLATIPTVF